MKYFLLIWVLLFAVSAFSQDMDATQIKKRMGEIRKTTNWDDPVAAKKANEEIKELSKKLMLAGKNQTPTNQTDSLKLEQEKENIDYKLKLLGQIHESVRQGENADILLGKPIREEIIEEFKEDEKIKFGPIVTDELEVLVIDMSVYGVQILIDNMDLFKSIKTLFITGGENSVPTNLSIILKKAEHYPLKDLYIVNFKNHVTSLPAEISTFNYLDTLGIFGNKFSFLPSSIEKIKTLKVLYVDNNPIKTMLPGIIQLKNLEKLGLVNTSISESEILKIKNLLPNCKVLIQ
jgi:hypothetical protein